MKQEFLECLFVTILNWSDNIFKDEILKQEFFQKPKVRQTESFRNFRKESELK